MIKTQQIRAGGVWTGIKRFNLTHFQFNNQPFIPTHKLFETKNIFHPIVIGWKFKSHMILPAAFAEMSGMRHKAC